MADLNLNFRQNVSPKVTQRTVLVGRVKMAQAIHLPETEWAKIISDIEKDPLVRELLDANLEGHPIIRYKRMGRSGMSYQFYEMQDADVVGSTAESPETLLDRKKHLLKIIEKIGQANFERYFLYREGVESLEQIAGTCSIPLDQAKEVQDFILDMSVQSEFYHPSRLASPDVIKPTLVGRIIRNEDRTYSISFFSPHLARGTYEIDHGALRRWQRQKGLDRQGAAKLRKFIGLLELSNMKQGAFWRVIDHLLKIQKDYFDTKDVAKMAPLSLRKVARQLQFAPSTISRVMANKSVLLPWDHEVLLISLMPGQRKIVLEILEKLLSGGRKHITDAELARKIEASHGVKVSRRTITACRHVLLKK